MGIIKTRVLIACLMLITTGCGWLFWHEIVIKDKATVADRLQQYGDSARQRLLPYFQSAGVAYPPKALVFLGLKQERRLELYAGDDADSLRFIRSYPILAASGVLGPKLQEGDHQVPEGLYRIDGLNPNSRFHLSMRVNYPNEFDRRMAENEGRSDLGGDIFIHGRAVSVGCLAMGDPVAEELFVLVAETGKEQVRVILSPVDFRVADLPTPEHELLPWSVGLYKKLDQVLFELSRLAKQGP